MLVLYQILEGNIGEPEHFGSSITNIFFGQRARRDHVEDQRLFYALRQEFIKNREVMYPFKEESVECQVNKDINFGRYLSMCMGETLAEVVEVSVTTWAVMGVLAALFYILMLLVNDDSRILGWTMVGCGWVVTLFNYVFESKLVKIRNSFAPAAYLTAIEGRGRKGTITRSGEMERGGKGGVGGGRSNEHSSLSALTLPTTRFR